MKEEKLQLLRSRLAVVKEELAKREQKIRRLESTNEVKEYLMLRKLNNIDSREYKYDEEKQVLRFIQRRFLTENDETNNIYYENDFVYPYEDDGIKCLYTDIENQKLVFVSEKDIEEFERTHTILETEEGYFKVSVEFYRDAINNGQEEAVKNIIKKYGKY